MSPSTPSTAPPPQQQQNFFTWLTTPPDGAVVSNNKEKNNKKSDNDDEDDELVKIMKSFKITETATTPTTKITTINDEDEEEIFALQHPSHVPTPKTIDHFDLADVQKGIEDEIMKFQKSALSLFQIQSPLSSSDRKKKMKKYCPSPETPPESPIEKKKGVLTVNDLPTTKWGPNFWSEETMAGIRCSIRPPMLGSNHRQTIVQEEFNCSLTFTTVSSDETDDDDDDDDDDTVAVTVVDDRNDKHDEQRHEVSDDENIPNAKSSPPRVCRSRSRSRRPNPKTQATTTTTTTTRLQKQWDHDISNNLHQYNSRSSIRLLDHDDMNIPPSIEFVTGDTVDC